MISSLLHLVGLGPRVYYTLTNFRGGAGRGQGPLPPPKTPMQITKNEQDMVTDDEFSCITLIVCISVIY